MKIIKDKKLKSNIILVTYVIVLAYIFINFKSIGNFLIDILLVIKPFIIGVALAYVINIPMRFFEKKVVCKLFGKTKKDYTKLKRIISLTLTIITVIAVITAIVLFVVPQVVKSFTTLANNIPDYIDSLEKVVSQYKNSNELLKKIYTNILAAGKEIINLVSSLSSKLFSGIVDITVGVTSSVINFIIAFIVSIYILLSKEKLILQVKKILYSIFEKNKVNKIIKLWNLVNDKFSRFVTGQCIEACILGLLCFIGMSIFKMPYKLLISVLIGVTSLIPIVGAFLGLIPSVFILFMVSPMTAFWFIILILVIQQIEGHLIYPFVIGNSIGLSSLWVLFAITVGGNSFGVLGMLIGVPLVGVVYSLGSYIVNKRLKEKNLYIKSGHIVEITSKEVEKDKKDEGDEEN